MAKQSNSGFRSGQRAPRSGQYGMEGPRGGQGPERTIVKGEPFPPTLRPGMRYRLKDPTKTR